PKDATTHHDLAFAVTQQRKWEEAIGCYRTAIGLDPKDARAYWSMGILLCDEMRDHDAAVAAFRKALSLQPELAHVQFNLGLALFRKGDVKQAISAFQEAIRLQPTYAQAHTYLARCWTTCSDLQLRNPQGAVEEAKKGVELAPDSDAAWLVLGWANYRVGEWKASLAALE